MVEKVHVLYRSLLSFGTQTMHGLYRSAVQCFVVRCFTAFANPVSSSSSSFYYFKKFIFISVTASSFFVISPYISGSIVLSATTWLTTAGSHMPYGITECYLPPDRGCKAGTRFCDTREMQSWVDLVYWLHSEIIYPPKDDHPSTNHARQSSEVLST